MSDPIITVITPTTGKDSLFELKKSIAAQTLGKDKIRHILLWDNKREEGFLYPDPESLTVKNPSDVEDDITNCIVIKDSVVKGKAYGSALRAIGLMIANTKYVTFADDDVWYDDNHLQSLVGAISSGHEWGYCGRKIWTSGEEYLGKDVFESVGDSPNRRVPYEMVDNSSMVFTRRFGSSAAVLYRETTQYNDDRLMYEFLKNHGGDPARTNQHTVNQVCPERLEDFFRNGCEK